MSAAAFLCAELEPWGGVRLAARCLKGASVLPAAYSLSLAAADAPSSQLPHGGSYGRYRSLANRPRGRCPAGHKSGSYASLPQSRSESAVRLTGKAAAAAVAPSLWELARRFGVVPEGVLRA